MTSAYLPDGIRIDHMLSLRAGGGFIWRTRHEGRSEHSSRGTWRHNHNEQVLYFTPSQPGQVYGPDNPQLWRVLGITGLEGANTFTVLRWVALASRDLPVLFYRVHVGAAEPLYTI